MSFGRLPPELKAEIVWMVYQADLAFHRRGRRKWRDSDDYDEDVFRTPPEGDALLNLSLVNVELRKLCSKHLFETLAICPRRYTDTPVAQSLYDELLLMVVRANIGQFVTRVDFLDLKYDVEKFFQDIVYYLPNLRHISGLTPQALAWLMGGIRRDQWGMPDVVEGIDAWLVKERERQARAGFLVKARHVTSWSLEGSSNDIERIIELNSEGIEHLSLLAPTNPTPEDPSFDHPDSRYPRILAGAKNLKSLELEIFRLNQFEDPIHPNALSVLYPFTETLEELTFNCQGYLTSSIPGILHFAALFPRLRVLDLTKSGFRRNSTDARKAILPAVTTLSLCHLSPRDLAEYLHFVDLPSVETIHCRIPLRDADAIEVWVHDPAGIEMLGAALAGFKSLRALHLETVYETGVPRESIEILRRALSRTKVEIRTNFFIGDQESRVPFAYPDLAYSPDPFFDSVDIEAYEAYDSPATFDAGSNGAKELSKWISNRVGQLEATRDIVAAKELMRNLQGMAELKMLQED